MTLKMVQKVIKYLGLKVESDESVKELCEETNVNRVAQALNEKSK